MLGATLLRRAKMLLRQNYLSVGNVLNLPGLTLQQRWLKWVEQECQKRLVYFAMTLDAHVSASRKIAVLFPYAELETPLPATRPLWLAKSAGKWLELLPQDIELRLHNPPLHGQLLRQPQLIAAYQPLTDTASAAFIFLAGFWSLIAEYHQTNAISPSEQTWNEIVLGPRHSDLTSTLNRFRAELVDLDILRPELLVALEFASLHLHVSFYVLSNYAGRRTEDDARLASPYVQRWYESPRSRTAIWNAAQIFRAAKLFKPRGLADIYAIALYHAALVLWVWSLVRKTQGTVADASEPEITLDGEESAAVWRFQRASRGRPGLTNESGHFLPLDNPATVPELANQIVTTNWRPEQMPLTTKEVSPLMQEFGAISRHKFK